MTAVGKRRPGSRRYEGFTLVELLVAIAILGLFMTVSMGAVRIAARSTHAGVDRADTTEELRSVAEFLRRQLGQVPRLTVAYRNEERLAFAGQERSLRFVAPAPRFLEGVGLVTYSIAAERIDGLEYLTLQFAPFDPAGGRLGNEVASQRRIISSGFEDVTFEYYGSGQEHEHLEWKSDWPADAAYYPRAIRIRTHPGKAQGGWPDLVLPLRSGEGA